MHCLELTKFDVSNIM